MYCRADVGEVERTVGYDLFQEQTLPLAKIDTCECYMQIFKVEGLVLAK